jgi:hypothetical protein
MTARAMTYDELPLQLTSFLERESWVRVAASALYVDRIASTAVRQPFVDLAMYGGCFEPNPFLEFERAINLQIVDAFGLSVRWQR